MKCHKILLQIGKNLYYLLIYQKFSKVEKCQKIEKKQ